VISSSDLSRIGAVSISPDSKWVAFSKQDRTVRSHVYIAPITGGEERHLSDESLMYSETNAVWTADGRYVVFTSAEGASNGIASQGGINTTMELWRPRCSQDRDPMNRDIDNEAQGLAGGSGGAAETPDAGRRGAAARRGEDRLERSRASRATPHGAGTAISGLTPAPEGHAVALNVSTGGIGGGRGAARGQRSERRDLHHRCREQPAHAHPAGSADCRRRRRTWDVAAPPAGGSLVRAAWCSRTTPDAVLPIGQRSVRGCGPAEHGRRGHRRRRRGGRGAAAPRRPLVPRRPNRQRPTRRRAKVT